MSRTLTAAMVRSSSHTLTYALRPSGLKAMNCGGPASIGMVAVTLFDGRVDDGDHAGVRLAM